VRPARRHDSTGRLRSHELGVLRPPAPQRFGEAGGEALFVARRQRPGDPANEGRKETV
jgi:hypothetical protein